MGEDAHTFGVFLPGLVQVAEDILLADDLGDPLLGFGVHDVFVQAAHLLGLATLGIVFLAGHVVERRSPSGGVVQRGKELRPALL